MPSENYEDKVQELKNRVDQLDIIVPDNQKESFLATSNKISNGVVVVKKKNFQEFINKYKNKFIYFIPPIFLLILLIIIKPSFILKSLKDDNNKEIKKLNYTNLILFSIGIGFLLDIGIYTYMKKK